MNKFGVVFIFCILLQGCYWMRSSKGGGEVSHTDRKIDARDIALQPGYTIDAVVSNLTFPTAVAFDEDDNLFIIEAGYSYGEVWETPRLLAFKKDNSLHTIAEGTKNGPWTGVTFYNGKFYVAEGGQMEGGRILSIDKNGKITSLLDGLPSLGDHHTNGPVIWKNHIYFSLGVATNSGVVGNDNAEFGWLLRKRDFHDIPCEDITLSGQNYTVDNVLTEEGGDKITTGPFLPYGTPCSAGQVIKGQVPCSGSIMRIPIAGGKPELICWGFRNPFGLAVSPDDQLYTTDNGYDERGSRPVWGTGDILWRVQEGQWYGWPDFSAGEPISGEEEFKSPKHGKVMPLLKDYPKMPPDPVAVLGVHSSSDGFDFSFNDAFGFKGEAFIAQFGDMSGAGKVLAPVGFKVVRVNPNTGVIRDFAVNKGKKNGPASWHHKGGLERPVAVQFNNEGTALYIVDFGNMRTTKKGIEPIPNTGVIWRITKRK